MFDWVTTQNLVRGSKGAQIRYEDPLIVDHISGRLPFIPVNALVTMMRYSQ